MKIFAIKETRREDSHKFKMKDKSKIDCGDITVQQYVSFTEYSKAYEWLNRHYKNLIYVQQENMYGVIFDYWYYKDCNYGYIFFQIVPMVVDEKIYMGD